MNPCNGICLCAIHDRAFDKGLLIIDTSYRISLHPTIHKIERTDSVNDYFVKFDGNAIALPDRWHPMPNLLQRHGELVTVS
jgi:putative restriction endonuclease